MTGWCPSSIDELLTSRIVIVAPHMDDEVLACGGLMLMHKDKSRLHCIFATDGARSPSPLLPWQGKAPKNLPEIRAREANEVLNLIGLSSDNRAMFGLPDGQLVRHGRRFRALLEKRLDELNPDCILVPFRYDLHSDHVAVHRTVRNLWNEGRIRATVFEYIVYFRWRLIKSGDIRTLIRPDRLFVLNTSNVRSQKREALLRYTSQTSRLYDWQESPILTPESIDTRCRDPETFLLSEPGEPLVSCFSRSRSRALLAHYVERLGKRKKDQVVASAKWAASRLARSES